MRAGEAKHGKPPIVGAKGVKAGSRSVAVPQGVFISGTRIFGVVSGRRFGARASWVGWAEHSTLAAGVMRSAAVRGVFPFSSRPALHTQKTTPSALTGGNNEFGFQGYCASIITISRLLHQSEEP